MALFDFFRPNRTPLATPVKDTVVIPPGRSSRPTFGTDAFLDVKGRVAFVNPGFIADYIPVIRKLSWINPDLGLAVNDMVQLTNTGHRIKFDPSVSSDEQKR